MDPLDGWYFTTVKVKESLWITKALLSRSFFLCIGEPYLQQTFNVKIPLARPFRRSSAILSTSLSSSTFSLFCESSTACFKRDSSKNVSSERQRKSMRKSVSQNSVSTLCSVWHSTAPIRLRRRSDYNKSRVLGIASHRHLYPSNISVLIVIVIQWV